MEQKIVARFSRAVLKKTQQVIVPTKKVEKLLKTYEVKEPISVIPTGIELKNFQTVLSERRENQKKSSSGTFLRRTEGTGQCGTSGKREKSGGNPKLFCKSYQRRKTEFKLKLLIVGDGPDRERLEKLARILELQEK